MDPSNGGDFRMCRTWRTLKERVDQDDRLKGSVDVDAEIRFLWAD